MKSLTQLGFLKLPFRKEETKDPAEDTRVMALFKNRAELKKAYGELQEEIYRLKDRIKQQEGATVRVQEMLNALEMRLGISESAYPALVFYQLRRLWQSGREIIEQVVADLRRHQAESERRAINIAAIAYAEVLCLRLAKTQLVRLAREATGRREATDEYGSREECEAIMAEIDRARGALLGRTNIAQEVKARSERIKQIAR